MIAYFDSTAALKRFDVLGDASAIFYIKEDSTFSTVNKSQAKMLYADFKEGEINRINYFQEVKNDVFPLAQMTRDDKTLKGFDWLPDKRPKSRYDITSLPLRSSQRKFYAGRPMAIYEQTDIYFPGYMEGVYKEIADKKLAAAKAKENSMKKAASDVAPLDSIIVDNTVMDTLALKDTLAKEEHKKISSHQEEEKSEKAEAKSRKQAEREAEWARLDSLDAAKIAAAQAKKAARIRARKLAVIKASKAQEAKDKVKLERYKARYEKRKAKQAARRAKRKAVNQNNKGAGDDIVSPSGLQNP